MFGCRKYQGMIAASLYEPLSVDEQRQLSAHLGACPACAEASRSLGSLVRALPDAAPPFTGDLLPALQSERPTVRDHRPFSTLKPVIAYTALFVLACVVFAFARLNNSQPDLPPVAAVNPPIQTIDAAYREAAAGDVEVALAMLEEAREAAATPTEAGALLLAAANIEYGYMRRYAIAYDKYKSVFDNYGEAWAQSEGAVKDRFDLLTEARDQAFEPLYQVDSARLQGEAGIPVLEDLMARYPGRAVAREALGAMLALVDGEGVTGLEAVKVRCTNPVALAQVDVHLGERYCADRLNPERGRALLMQVAGGGHEVPARMARDVLARLDNPNAASADQ
ncbi:MAG: zf-HC2 domain-containing protein [Candidatus Hydrogenedentes bacterium]|nr:zf-HC2 domain-containing protein [Candidatus Hydrogenedentota bacterium]